MLRTVHGNTPSWFLIGRVARKSGMNCTQEAFAKYTIRCTSRMNSTQLEFMGQVEGTKFQSLRLDFFIKIGSEFTQRDLDPRNSPFVCANL